MEERRDFNLTIVADIADIKATTRSILDRLDAHTEWQKEHMKETHSVIDRRLSDHSGRLNFLAGVAKVVGAIGGIIATATIGFFVSFLR